MTNPHEMHVVTYHSVNAESGKEWLAYLVLPSGRLPVAFFAETEESAVSEATDLWDKHAAERQINHDRREEGRRKAAETRAKKKESAK